MARRSIEPLLWLLFSAGGVLAALLLPILCSLFGVAFPLGWLPAPDHDQLLSLLRHPIARVGAVRPVCAVAGSLRLIGSATRSTTGSRSSI